MRIVEDDLSREPVQALLEQHARGMEEHSPPGSCHYFDSAALRASDVTVWSIWDQSALAGVGALREIDATHGEIKSMRTADEHLGKGVGRQMLHHIIDEGRARDYRRLSLETGSTEAFQPALGLYRSAGFLECGPFDSYEISEFSVYFTLEL